MLMTKSHNFYMHVKLLEKLESAIFFYSLIMGFVIASVNFAIG